MDWNIVTQELLAEARRLDAIGKALPDQASEGHILFYAVQVSLLTSIASALAKGALADIKAKVSDELKKNEGYNQKY